MSQTTTSLTVDPWSSSSTTSGYLYQVPDATQTLLPDAFYRRPSLAEVNRLSTRWCLEQMAKRARVRRPVNRTPRRRVHQQPKLRPVR